MRSIDGNAGEDEPGSFPRLGDGKYLGDKMYGEAVKVSLNKWLFVQESRQEAEGKKMEGNRYLLRSYVDNAINSSLSNRSTKTLFTSDEAGVKSKRGSKKSCNN